uniref:Cytochrome p450 n=1 Tax=Moniliophthora roreri TaxID=221103 RepID=A0A0W0FEI2_MONRR
MSPAYLTSRRLSVSSSAGDPLDLLLSLMLPLRLVPDDEYMGYFIPKDAMVIPNITSMHMDPAIFDDPETFNPQRYVDNPSLPGHVFGFGRRYALFALFLFTLVRSSLILGTEFALASV